MMSGGVTDTERRGWEKEVHEGENVFGEEETERV